MDEKLIEFAALLRDNGIRVSLAETLDAVDACRRVGLADRAAVYAALRCTMVKRAADGEAFDRLFALFFSGLGEVIKQASQAVQRELALSEREFQELIDQLAQLLAAHEGELSPLARELLAADSARLERRIRDAAREIRRLFPAPAGGQYRLRLKLAELIGLRRLERELGEIRQLVEESGYDPLARARMGQYVERRFNALETILQRYAGGETGQDARREREAREQQTLREKNLYYMSEQELDRIKGAVAHLAQRLKSAASVRRRITSRGRFDAKKTLRRSLRWGGVPFVLRFDKRKKDKPQIVVLCDVSDSVRNVARFMLQLMYSLQDLYWRVRSFIFVAELGEVTSHFRENDVGGALELALNGAVINVYAHSNFGRAFRIFAEDYAGAVNKKTTVLVLGDGRNNYNLPGDQFLGAIRRRAKQVLWLNPEGRATWGFGDSEMARYALQCDVVEECRNLNQLYRVVDRLLAR
jgi:uncharacterized protein with von Willebrand factor type A (vWA) domain